MVRARLRLGFTLIELLVVIAIIAILIALLVPAVQKVREAAARTQCLNNLKQVALATQNYHDAYKSFPYAARDYQPYETTASYDTGFIKIMPFLEQDAVAKRWDPKLPRNSTIDNDGDGYTNAMLQKMLIPTYVCPSMSPPSGTLGGAEQRAYCSYLFNAGSWDCQLYAYWSMYGLPEPPAFDGAIIPIYSPENTAGPRKNTAPTRMGSMSDGTSNTFLVGETDFKPKGVPSTEMGGIWGYGYIGYTYGSTFHPFNKHDNTATVYGAFRSEHSGGCNFALVDGSVRFVTNSVTLAVYRAYSTRAGNEVASLD
jgi:prepilin-type N-terminal cleavage/methylation domain-containing protein/prepilin-type processing-associated H-X9-DG protein